MKTSLVITAALEAFRVSRSSPGAQSILSRLRSMQPTLFEDIQTTLETIPEGPDLTVYGHDLDKDFSFRSLDLRRWIDDYPDGVAFPITVAASVNSDAITAPMRVLIVVPFGCKRLLVVPHGLASMKATAWWGADQIHAEGPYGALVLGMYSHDDGEWEYGPVVGWAAVLPHNETVQTHGIPILPEFVLRKAEAEGLSTGDATNKLLLDYTSDEIGFLLSTR